MGVTFWDTANNYQLGTSEEVVGRAIRRYSRREDIVLATKVWGWMHDGPGGHGLGVGTVPYSPQGNRWGGQAPSPAGSVAALDLHLTGDEIRSLEEPYTPHGPAWY
jgi:Aldo/keto reductase family